MRVFGAADCFTHLDDVWFESVWMLGRLSGAAAVQCRGLETSFDRWVQTQHELDHLETRGLFPGSRADDSDPT